MSGYHDDPMAPGYCDAAPPRHPHDRSSAQSSRPMQLVKTPPRVDLSSATTVDMVRLGYGDTQDPPLQARSLDFRTEMITSFDEFSSCLRAIGEYNCFDAEKVIDALGPLWSQLMYVNVGRECSPVIYVHLPCWTHQRIGERGGWGEPLGNEAILELAGRVRLALRAAEADEVGSEVIGGMVHTVRGWWD